MANDGELSMVIVGDVFVRRDDPPSMFRHVGDLLRGADFTLGNLETPVADSGIVADKGPSLALKGDARQITAIEAVRFDAMGVANNHSLDYGYDALFETLAHLDRIGVAHSGAGRTKSEAHAPAIVERRGCRVALLAYTSVFMPGWEATDDRAGVAAIHVRTAYEPPPRYAEVPGTPAVSRTWAYPPDKERLGADIAAARARADLVICCLHWGVSERYVKLTDYQVEVGHYAIDAGADLVFGHHPHVLQGVEAYRGRAIFYSLGNFAFDLYRPDWFDLETIVVRCGIRDRRIVTVEYLPARGDAQQHTPQVLSLEQGQGVVRMIEERSSAFGTKFRAVGDAMRLVLD